MATSSFQIAYAQESGRCVDPTRGGDICGGSDHQRCCAPASDGNNYVCIGTDGKEIDIDKSDDIGNCEKKK